ncbi:MAG: hypothetical protein HKN54_01880 [Flavobacteriaceae bacterium]|nr:hypothetical protein [Flavobacteriaceae bacterium]
MIKRVKNKKAYKLTFYWTVFAVILLSIIPEKKSRYLMPVLIPLALNTGFYINYLIRNIKDLGSKLEMFPVYLNFILMAIIGLGFSVGGYIFLKDKANVNWLIFGLASVVLAFIGLSILVQLKKKRMKHLFYAVILFVVSAYVFVSPLSKHIKTHAQNPISQLKDQTAAEGLNVYRLDYVSPEMIWQFGDELTSIKSNDSTFDFPSEAKFGILTKELSDEDKKKINSDYIMEFRDTFDLNTVSPESKKYRSRLVNSFYVLTKK